MAIIATVLLWPFSLTQAATFKWQSSSLSYNAKSTSLTRVLTDIFVSQYRPVQISDAVRALPPVNGTFNQTPESLFVDLSRAYGLVSYFDGTAMHVTTLAENRSIMQALSYVSPREVEKAAQTFGYFDKKYSFKKITNPAAVQYSGPPVYIKKISEVIFMLEGAAKERRLDSKMVFKVIPLLHAWAEDTTYSTGGRDVVIKGLVGTLRQLIGSGVNTVPVGSPSHANKLDPAPLITDSPKGPASILESIFSRPQAADGNQDNDLPPLPLPRTPAAESDPPQIPGVHIAGDSRANAVVIMASNDMMSAMEEIIERLDVEPELIQIEATVMEVQGGALDELGVDWSLKGNNFGLQSNIVSGNSGGDDQAAISPLHNLSVMAGNQAIQFIGRINALQSKGQATILSNPKIATLNSTEAVLSSRQIFYPKVKGERVAQLYRIETGLMMRVLPFTIRKPGMPPEIRLRVLIEDGNIDDSVPRIDGLPITNESTIITQAVVRDGNSLLIGGYVKDSNSTGEAKVPLLGDIPYLGALFRYKKAHSERKEHLFLITPKLLKISQLGNNLTSKLSDQEPIHDSGVADDDTPDQNKRANQGTIEGE